MPELMARVFLLRGGKKEQLKPSKPELGLVENFVHMLGIEGDEADRMNRVLRFFFILHLDHGGVIFRPSQEKLLLQEGHPFMLQCQVQ